ncbi:hypothetical protein Cgig2_004819 [Carnegiea gigantea]|uniref:Reverse transcriptase n=1 Tax=Carnegiea gigantea TaxID=171969 RepID=A0A9Q1KXG3_9CARY|nr:hypothetical protein Cgig2_004819 [Carnegiea gigantea]
MFQLIHKQKHSKNFCKQWCQEWKQERLELWVKLYSQVEASLNDISDVRMQPSAISNYQASNDKLIQAIHDLVYNGNNAAKSSGIALCQHTLLIYQVPIGILQKLNSLILNFFWTNSQGTLSIHWTKKEQCQQHREKGSLGIRDLVTWNYALLMRQAWRIYSKPHLLLAQLYRGMYRTHSPIEITYYDNNDGSVSWGRKGLTRAASKIIQGLRWHIRNGHTVRILEGRWCNNRTINVRAQVDPNAWKDRPVSDLFNEFRTGWNIGKVRSIFPCHTTRLILAQHIRPTVSHDRLYWSLSNNGEYNSKLGYLSLMNQQTPPACNREIKLWKILWALRISTCWKVLLWKVYHNALPVGRNR